MNTPPNTYKYLRRKPGSNYRHLFIFDANRYVSALTVYGDHANDDCPRSVEEIAEDRDLPVDAVREAIAYCESNPPEIREDWEMEEASMQRLGMNDPKYRGQPKRTPIGHTPPISA
jgi:hypothetical protein